jgi:DNA gyrase subunit A
MEQYGLSEKQAQAILDMRLQRLTGLERQKVVEEYSNVVKEIDRLRNILDDETLLMSVVRQELLELKEEYGDSRRTEIVQEVQELDLVDYITEEDMVVTVSHAGYIKRSPVHLYRSQRRGGKGRTGTRPRQEDFVELLFVASTHDYLLFFTNLGRIHWLKVYELPEASPLARGKAIVNQLQLQGAERVATILPVREFETNMYVVMATRKGVVKKTDLMAFGKPRAGGIIAVKIDEGDELINARLTDGSQQLFFTTQAGKSLRIREEEIRAMGRARGSSPGRTADRRVP